MRNAFYVIYVGLLISMTSCEESFEMDFPDHVSNGVVFNGVITNENPPYFFQLIKPASMSAKDGTYEGINDAMLVLEDLTAGILDTMKLVMPYEDIGGIFYDFYDYHKKRNTRESINGGNGNRCEGMYVTTSIYGIEGHSYQLHIYHGEHHYFSDIQKMESALVITKLELKRFDLGEKGESWAPCISFVNPSGVDNYYLFKPYFISYKRLPIARPFALFGRDTHWGYSILSDEFLEDNVVDFLIDDGENPLGYPNGRDYPKSDSVFIWAQTISKSCYDVFVQMREQFRTDGGAYTPVPTTIKGNISGGVYGCFRVSAVSEKGISVKREKNAVN